MSLKDENNPGSGNNGFYPYHESSINSSSKRPSQRHEATEEIFVGNGEEDYNSLLDSLEQEFQLGGLTGYDDPEAVRINYRVEGSGSQWNGFVQIEVDEEASYREWIKDSIDSVRNALSDPNHDLAAVDLDRKKTDTHTYHGRDISAKELDQFVEGFLNN